MRKIPWKGVKCICLSNSAERDQTIDEGVEYSRKLFRTFLSLYIKMLISVADLN